MGAVLRSRSTHIQFLTGGRLAAFGLVLCLSQGSGAEPLAGPSVTAKSAIIMDESSGRILWSKNPDKSRYPASTTKIMTSMLLLENRRLTDEVIAPPGVEKVTGSSLHLLPGEVISVKDAVYAMMLRSANDVCQAVAIEMSGTTKHFADLMNERAKLAGATNTHFNNPNGLNDPKHTTTAHDLAMIAREAMQNATFRDIVKTKSYTVTRSLNTLDRLLKTRNTYLSEDPTADGIKTGFTKDAGHCYVGSATRDGFRIITVILDSAQWTKDHAAMLNWAYKNFQVSVSKEVGEPLTEVALDGGTVPTVAVGPTAPLQLLNRRATTKQLEFVWQGKPPMAPVRQGTPLGSVKVLDADGNSVLVPVVALEEIPARPLSLAERNGPFILIGGAALLCGAWLMKRRPRPY